MPAIMVDQYKKIPAWNRWFCSLQISLMLGEKNGEKFFKEYQHRTRGFIVALWDDKTSIMPSRYLRYYFGTRRLDAGLNSLGHWEEFGDPNIPENPKQWKSAKKTVEVVEEIRPHQGEKRVGITYWIHPDAGYLPEDYHLLMNGVKFPGSPTQ